MKLTSIIATPDFVDKKHSLYEFNIFLLIYQLWNESYGTINKNKGINTINIKGGIQSN